MPTKQLICGSMIAWRDSLSRLCEGWFYYSKMEGELDQRRLQSGDARGL
jgi:hypothetical protein